MDKKMVVDICQVIAPTGHEEAVRDYIISQIKDYVDEYQVDPLGNLIARKKADGPKMMLAGHMDQIGFMISHIDENGFLRFATLGGFVHYVLYNRRVRFANGTIGVISCEQLTDMKKDFTMDKLYIDIAACNKEDAEKKVKIGDVCVYANETYANDDVVISPCLDDRIGCYIMIEALKQTKNPVYDTYYVFTVQEEIGLKGARASGYSVDPDYAIAYDVTRAYDTPNAMKLPMKMGGGATIKIMDQSLICDKDLVNHMEQVAKDNNINHQFEILTQGGTDSGAIQQTKGGVPAGVISVPTRYIHTDNEMCKISDIDDAVALTVKLLETKMK